MTTTRHKISSFDESSLEFGEPLFDIVVSVNHEGLAVDLSTAEADTFHGPRVVLERRADRWVVMVHGDGSNIDGTVLIPDDGKVEWEDEQ